MTNTDAPSATVTTSKAPPAATMAAANYLITGRPVGSPINPPEADLLLPENGVGSTISLDLTQEVADSFAAVGSLEPE